MNTDDTNPVNEPVNSAVNGDINGDTSTAIEPAILDAELVDDEPSPQATARAVVVPVPAAPRGVRVAGARQTSRP